ncbi:hypothetical protein ACRQ5B_08450 [Pseudarthrobacter sp. L19]|uniref:hypothetical protein n=1 Tax=Pseudarthrobacter sp. L19 TaxID=3423951 RepID=UPI003D7A5A4F
MNEQGNGQLRAPNRTDGPAEQQSSVQAPSHGKAEQPRFTVDKPNIKNNEAVAGPFTVRDLTVFGSVLVLFVASLIPMFAVRYNLWNLGSLFFLGLGILLPLIVAALFVARRVSPGTRLRIGSLSVDQFGSVVASFSVAFFFLAAAGAFVPSMLLGLIGALGLFTATVLARMIPALAGDFLHRPEAPAHVVARAAAAPSAAPAPLRPPSPPPKALPRSRAPPWPAGPSGSPLRRRGSQRCFRTGSARVRSARRGPDRPPVRRARHPGPRRCRAGRCPARSGPRACGSSGGSHRSPPGPGRNRGGRGGTGRVRRIRTR